MKIKWTNVYKALTQHMLIILSMLAVMMADSDVGY